MKTLLVSALALGLMTSAALAAESTKPTATTPAAGSGPVVLTATEMDQLKGGVCIGNCPGQKTQVGVGVQASCVIGGNNCGNRQGQQQ